MRARLGTRLGVSTIVIGEKLYSHIRVAHVRAAGRASNSPNHGQVTSTPGEVRPRKRPGKRWTGEKHPRYGKRRGDNDGWCQKHNEEASARKGLSLRPGVEHPRLVPKAHMHASASQQQECRRVDKLVHGQGNDRRHHRDGKPRANVRAPAVGNNQEEGTDEPHGEKRHRARHHATGKRGVSQDVELRHAPHDSFPSALRRRTACQACKSATATTNAPRYGTR